MAQTKLQIFAIATHFLAIIFLVTAAGLFADAYIRYNNELNALGHGNSKICILYLKENFTHPNNSICNFAIIGDFLATIFMVLLIILSFVKLFRGQVGNKISFAEFFFLLLSFIFALAVAIILISGWAMTCNTVNHIAKAAGISSDCDYGYMKRIPASAGFAAFAVVIIAGSFFFTIKINCFGSKESDNNNWTRFTNV